MRLGVSPAAASTPMGVFNQWFEALFPGTETRGCGLCHLVHQLLPHLESSTPSHLSLPLLLVWMNVSSLSPSLSDFHTVQFSVSSGCFLFLNLSLTFFGCARRHSVSTYASILAGSLVKLHHSFLMHSFTDGHLGCLQHLHVINNTAMNIGLQRFS